MFLDHFNAVNSKSVDIEDFVRKPINRELFDQSYNICSIFGRNAERCNLLLSVYCCLIFPLYDSQPLFVDGMLTAAPSYL